MGTPNLYLRAEVEAKSRTRHQVEPVAGMSEVKRSEPGSLPHTTLTREGSVRETALGKVCRVLLVEVEQLGHQGP